MKRYRKLQTKAIIRLIVVPVPAHVKLKEVLKADRLMVQDPRQLAESAGGDKVSHLTVREIVAQHVAHAQHRQNVAVAWRSNSDYVNILNL